MIKIIFSLFLILFFAKGTDAQDVFFKTGRNFTTYNYKNVDGFQAIDFFSREGSSFEIGLGSSFSLSQKKETMNDKSQSTDKNWFRNEVSFMLNSYNSYGGNLNNNYSYETTFGGLKNQFSLLAQAGKLELSLSGIIGINKMFSGTQVLNNARFNLKKYEEFQNIFFLTGLGASAAYPLFDKSFLSVAYNYTVNMRANSQNREHVNFNSRLVLFGIHFKLD